MILLFLAAAVVPACATCHPAEAKSRASTPMKHALTPARDSAILKANPNLQYRSGTYRWSIARESGEPIYSVTDGNGTVTAKLQWVFGVGTMGQTYVYEQNGALYESTVSYYTLTKSLDFTPGHLDRSRRSPPLLQLPRQQQDRTDYNRRTVRALPHRSPYTRGLAFPDDPPVSGHY
jgi:hypothetical protein